MGDLRGSSGNEAADLLSTVEEIRGAGFPDLDKGLVEEILDTHRLYVEDRAEARKATEQIINRWVAANVQPGRRG